MPHPVGAHLTKHLSADLATSKVSPPSEFSQTVRIGRPSAIAATTSGISIDLVGRPASISNSLPLGSIDAENPVVVRDRPVPNLTVSSQL